MLGEPGASPRRLRAGCYRAPSSPAYRCDARPPLRRCDGAIGLGRCDGADERLSSFEDAGRPQQSLSSSGRLCASQVVRAPHMSCATAQVILAAGSMFGIGCTRETVENFALRTEIGISVAPNARFAFG
jgi:hypothetical protein